MCEFEADDWMIDETLPESFSLVGVFDRFFVADAGEAEALDYDADAFVVEVGHDDYDEESILSETGGDVFKQ